MADGPSTITVSHQPWRASLSGDSGSHNRSTVDGFGPGEQQLIASTREARKTARPLSGDADGLGRTSRAGLIDPPDLELRAPIRELDPRRDGRPIVEERDA